jgi:hypothetical protein
VAYQETREPELALAAFDEAARLAPTDPGPKWHRGMLLQKLGNQPVESFEGQGPALDRRRQRLMRT